MNREDIIRMAREAGMPPVEITSDKPVLYPVPDAIERFAALVAAAKETEMQDRLDRLDAMYKQVCQQRDQAMEMQINMQRAYIAAMQGKTQ